jgi:hypothetical protein
MKRILILIAATLLSVAAITQERKMIYCGNGNPEVIVCIDKYHINERI